MQAAASASIAETFGKLQIEAGVKVPGEFALGSIRTISKSGHFPSSLWLQPVLGE